MHVHVAVCTTRTSVIGGKVDKVPCILVHERAENLQHLPHPAGL